MKGIVFTEFLEMVEENHSPDVLDRIIEGADLPNDGAYTSVGTYDHREMIRLLSGLSAVTNVPVPELLRNFGQQLFRRFVKGYPDFFGPTTDAFRFLMGIEAHIHADVRKLYPDAELPRFDCSSPDPQHLIMEYQSSRALGDLAEGLILGCIAHFQESISLHREDLSSVPGSHVRFTLTRQPDHGQR